MNRKHILTALAVALAVAVLVILSALDGGQQEGAYCSAHPNNSSVCD